MELVDVGVVLVRRRWLIGVTDQLRQPLSSTACAFVRFVAPPCSPCPGYSPPQLWRLGIRPRLLIDSCTYVPCLWSGHPARPERMWVMRVAARPVLRVVQHAYWVRDLSRRRGRCRICMSSAPCVWDEARKELSKWAGACRFVFMQNEPTGQRRWDTKGVRTHGWVGEQVRVRACRCVLA